MLYCDKVAKMDLRLGLCGKDSVYDSSISLRLIDPWFNNSKQLVSSFIKVKIYRIACHPFIICEKEDP